MPDQTNEQLVALHFPRGGIDRTQAFDRQPVRPAGTTGYSHTTVYGCNVLTFDPGTQRARGGSRPGNAKFCSNQVNGSNSIQEINAIVETGLVTGGTGSVPGWGTPTTTFYARSRAKLIKSNAGPEVWSYWDTADNGSADLAAIDNYALSLLPASLQWIIVKDGSLIASGSIPTGSSMNTVSFCEDGTYFYIFHYNATTQQYGMIRLTKLGVVDGSATGLTPGVAMTTDAPTTSSVVTGGTVYTCFKNVGIIRTTAATLVANGVLKTNTQLATQAGANFVMDPGVTVTASVALCCRMLSVAGTTLAVVMRQVQNPTTGVVGNRFKVILVSTAGTFIATTAVLGDTSGSVTNFCSLDSDGTNFYALVGNSDASKAAVNQLVYKVRATDAALIWTSAPFGAVTHCQCYISGLTKLGISGPGFSIYLETTSGTVSGAGPGSAYYVMYDAGLVETLSVPLVDDGDPANEGNFNRAYVVVACAGGTLKVLYQNIWQPVLAGGGVISSTVKVVRSSVFSGKMFFVDGSHYSYYDATSNQHLAWTATAGTMPADAAGFKGKLICTWRGRVCVAGFRNQPGEVIMSRLGAPFDFDTGAVPSPVKAVSFANSNLGQVADAITGMIPYTDDVLVFLCASSIWQLNGDPANGGQLNRVTDGVGGAWGNAWCTDPLGNIYFMSSTGGIYTMVPGSQPVRFSQSIDDFLKDIDVDNVVVRMAWDHFHQGILITVSHTRASTEVHYFWQQPTNSWFLVKFGNNDHNPLCLFSFQGPTVGSRVILLGSFDGYVRYLTPKSTTDDGTAIESEIYLGPYLTPNLDDVMVKEMVTVLGSDTGTVTYEIKLGESAEEAFSAAVAVSGTIGAGRSDNLYIRRAAHALYCRLSSVTRWSMESVVLVTETQGNVRRRSR